MSPIIYQVLYLRHFHNFFIALYNPDDDLLSFPYFVDEMDTYSGIQRLGKGLTEYVIRTGESLLLTDEEHDLLAEQGETEIVGSPSAVWLGAPMQVKGKTLGALAVQHYTDRNAYTERDKQVMTFVAEQVATVTERKQAEDELVILSKAVESAGEAIFLTNLDGIIEYTNPEFTRLYGYGTDEVIGKVTPRILKSGVMAPRDYELYWETLLKKQVVQSELINKRKDGSTVTVESSSNPILDENGDIVGFLAIQRDVTERKQAEEALQRYSERLATLREIDQAILSAQSLQEIAQVIMSRIRQLIPCQRASVAHLDYGTNQYSYLAVNVDGETQLKSDQMYPLENFGSADKVRRGETHVVEDFSTIPDLSEAGQLLLNEGIRSSLTVPLVAEG